MWENGGSKYRGSSSRGPRYSAPGSSALPPCPAIESQRQSVELRKRLNPGPRNCKRVSIAGTPALGPGSVETESRSEARGPEIESRFFDSRSDADGSAPKLARGLRMPIRRHWLLRLRLYTRGTQACPCTSPARPAAPVKRSRLNIKGSSSWPLRTRLNLPKVTSSVTSDVLRRHTARLAH